MLLTRIPKFCGRIGDYLLCFANKIELRRSYLPPGLRNMGMARLHLTDFRQSRWSSLSLVADSSATIGLSDPSDLSLTLLRPLHVAFIGFLPHGSRTYLLAASSFLRHGSWSRDGLQAHRALYEPSMESGD